MIEGVKEVPGQKLDEMLEDLYCLDRNELRRLALEALLISDGPDRIEGEVNDDLIGVHSKELPDGDVLFTVVGLK